MAVWTLNKSNENTLATWERNILKKISGPVKENGVWGIRTNQELRNLYRQPDTLEIRKGRLKCLGHVERMLEERTVTKMFNNIPEGKRPVGKPMNMICRNWVLQAREK